MLFLIGNLDIFVVLFSAMSVALNPNTISLIALPVLLVLTLFLIMYALIHFLVIVPLAYFAYLITSVRVEAILNASSDVKIEIGPDTVRIKALILKKEVHIRNFAVGIPTYVVSLMLKIWPLVIRERQDN